MYMLERLLQDLRYGLRGVRKSPGFTAIAVLTLALGMGVSAAVFSVIDAVLLREPPYTAPDRLVTFRENFPRINDHAIGVSQSEFIDYRDRTTAFSALAGYEDAVFDFTGAAEPLRIQAERATASLFATLGVAPLAGRTFSADEDRPGAAPVLVMSYEFWQRRFGGSRDTLGSVMRLNERPYTVIGIMPPRFEFPFSAASVGEPPAVWVPMAFTPAEFQNRLAEFPVHIVARMKPGISPAQAEQDAQRVAAGFQREHADIYTGNLVEQVNVDSLGAREMAKTRPVLVTLAAAVFLVFLIACANVMNLLLARAAARRREMAMRSALGAGAGRLAVQLLTEGLLLAALAAAAGCLLAEGVIRLVSGVWPSFVSGLADVRVDWPVLLFLLAISGLAGLLCGMAPMLGQVRPELAEALKQAGRQGGSVPRQTLRRVLVVVEASSAVVLVVGASLLIHSLVEVLRVPIGFSPDGVLIARTTFNRQRYPSNEHRRAAERQMTERLAAIPGVAAVGLTTHIPLADDRQIGFILEGEDYRSSRWADNALVSGDYFGAMGIPILRGRTFDDRDRPDAPLATVINDSMARRLWPHGDALGKRIIWGDRLLNIIGIAGDVHVGALDAKVGPTIYTSVYQLESGATTSAVFVLRARAGDPTALAPAVRNAIWSVDRGVPVFDMRTMDQIVARSLTTRRFAATLLTAFAALALVLALIGLYGVLSYAVAQRTAELGLRFALGATPAQILSLVVGEGLRLTLLGVAIGALAGMAAARAMSHLLFGIGSFDPAAFALAATLLPAAALLASYLPARRAARVDPMEALRHE